MWVYIFQGIGLGFAAASQPGPFQAFLISQSLTRGWKRSLPAALAPLVSDGPIILLCVFVLSQLPDWLQRIMYIAGGLFILYLAYGTFKSWQSFEETLAHPESTGHQTVLKAAMTNLLSPGTYLFWTLVSGPILLQGWRETPSNGLAFLAGFYVTLICGLAAIIIVFGVAAKLGPKLNRILLGTSSIALFCFGSYQLWLGLAG
ncbi:MAG: LysE family transporter [Anaerolineales bacterium]|nr:LysE family transporter [Anaerolineales bacterium]